MTLRKTGAIALAVFALVVARDGLAQSSAPGFPGSWVRDLPAQSDGRPLPKSILRVAVNDQMLAVEEPSAVTGPHRRPSYYRLEPQADRWVVADGPQRMFRWLAPDRLELHDFMLGPGVRGTAVTEVWELVEGRRTKVVFDKFQFSKMGNLDLEMVAAHEGSHVGDAASWIKSGFAGNRNPSVQQTELAAYSVSAFIATGSGRYGNGLYKEGYLIWKPGLNLVETEIAIRNYLAASNVYRMHLPEAAFRKR